MDKKIIPPDIVDLSKKSGMPIEKVKAFLGMMLRAMQPLTKMIEVTEGKSLKTYAVERNGIGILTTKFGKFWEYKFAINDKWQDYSVIVRAGINQKTFTPVFKNKKKITIRIDSTTDVMGFNAMIVLFVSDTIAKG